MFSYRGPVSWKWVYNLLFYQRPGKDSSVLSLFLIYDLSYRRSKNFKPKPGLPKVSIMKKNFSVCALFCNFFFIHANNLYKQSQISSTLFVPKVGINFVYSVKSVVEITLDVRKWPGLMVQVNICDISHISVFERLLNYKCFLLSNCIFTLDLFIYP